VFKAAAEVEGIYADIREMFFLIKVHVTAQHAQRFLWRNGDSTQPIGHYAMTSLVLGAISSPFCADYVKNRNAEQYREPFLRAADANIEHHCVDDLVISFTLEEEGIEICKQIVQVHGYGGFEFRYFCSNSDTLQSVINGNQLSSDQVLGM